MQDREASFPELSQDHPIYCSKALNTGTHRGQILSATPFKGGTAPTCVK